LRIGDAVMLTPEKLNGNRLFLRMEKAGVPVFVPLPPFVIEALNKLPRYGGYYFWNPRGGSGASATGNAGRALRRIFKAAGVKAHPHQLRDSFVVGLLEKGVAIEKVSRLLGHSSVKITEKHYATWTRGLQDSLEIEVARTWEEPKLVRVK
jgi:integrase